jgi:CDP-glucose 4,6-dehydratase
MNTEFNGIYNGITVLVTGHTGFKGSWLAIWLQKVGANVVGFSLEEPVSTPSNFDLAQLSKRMTDVRGDVRDAAAVQNVMDTYKPKIVFHLAAQPIVLKAYDDPKATLEINSIGTANILEAVRHCDSVEAVVCITSDKAYKNVEQVWGYRENDLLGGTDPYSASKAMAELVIACYRESYFSGEKMSNKKVEVASTRAGNVIGGGDFADFRLVPDSMKALMIGKNIEIRNPYNVRPWQLVLEPLSGYLWLGAKMLQEKDQKYAQAWNFGPLTSGVTAGEVADTVVRLWGRGSWVNIGTNAAKHEPQLLMLDCAKAREYLGWKPLYTVDETLGEVVSWFKDYAQKNASYGPVDMYETCSAQIDKYTNRAKEFGLAWALIK